MSEPVLQEVLEGLVLVEFYEQAQKREGGLTREDVAVLLNNEFGIERLRLAINTLCEKHLIQSPSVYVGGQVIRYTLTDRGYKYVEKMYFDRLKEVEDKEIEADPVASLEAKIVPAANRMVSFSDNQESREDALNAVSQADKIIRSSNSLDVTVKEDAVSSLSAWQELIRNVRGFAVGAFKFLVWDRIKSVLEGGIEDTYKVLLQGIMITLGTLIVSML